MEEPSARQLNSPQGLVRADAVSIQEPEVLEVSPEEVPHLLDYWDVILKRRWVVLACLVVVFATVAIGTLKQKPLYQGDVQIEIDPEPPSVVNFREVVNVSPIDIEAYQQTQFKILQSRTLADRVVQDLQLYRYPEFYQGRSLFGLIKSNPVQLPPSSDAPPDTSADYYRNAVSHFMDVTDVSPVRNTNLVDVTFRSENPELAARIANKLADEYINENLQIKYDETMRASEWLEGQLAKLQVKVEQADDRLAEYARRNSIVFINDKQNLANAKLAQVQTDDLKAQNDRYQAQALYSLVAAGKSDDVPGIIDNRVIQDLEEKKADLERQYSDLILTVKPEYPKAVQLKKQIDTLQKSIDRQKAAVVKNIVDQYHAAVSHEEYLNKAVEQAKKEVNEIADKTITYNILKRDADSNHELYDGMLQRMKEAKVAAGLKASNIHIVDAAIVPKRPVRPRVLLNLALGVILGLGLGIGLAFFQEYLDKTLKTSDDVEQLLRLPSLGVLPRFFLNGHGRTHEESLVPLGDHGHSDAVAPAIQRSPEAVEAFRSLRTSILLSASPVPRLILVTSALPSEGKTTTAVNLGATLASLGSKVVVVDCDMRRPSCHRSTGVENNPGFVRCLTGHVGLQEAVLPVPGVANLYVIPCGPIPPNPAEVLSSPLAAELLRQLRAQFEYVLVDSPPLLSVSDSRILATMTDAVVLVTRAHSTPYDLVRRARSLLYGTGARILGVALNDVDLHQGGLGYEQYKYGYGYGYVASDNASEGHGGPQD